MAKNISNSSSTYCDYISEKNQIIKRLVFLSISLFVALFALIGHNFILSSKPASIPYVIEISQWGEAKYIGDIGGLQQTIEVSDQAKKYSLSQFVDMIRSRSFDKSVTVKNFNTLFMQVTTSGYNLLRGYAEESKPAQFVGRILVDIESILFIDENQYQINWVESIFSETNALEKLERFRGIFRLYIEPELTEEIMKVSPLGIFIDNWDIQKIEEKFYDK